MFFSGLLVLAIWSSRTLPPAKALSAIQREFRHAEKHRFGGWIAPDDDDFNTILWDADVALRSNDSQELRRIIVLSQLARGRSERAMANAQVWVDAWPSSLGARELLAKATLYSELTRAARDDAMSKDLRKVHIEPLSQSRFLVLMPLDRLCLYARKENRWVLLSKVELQTFGGGVLAGEPGEPEQDLFASGRAGEPVQIAVSGFWGDTSGGPCQSAEVFRLVGNTLKLAGKVEGHSLWIGDANHDGRWEYRNWYEIGRLMSHAGMPRWQDVYELKGNGLQRTSPSHPEIYRPYVARLRETLLDFPSDPELPFYFERAWRWSGHRLSPRSFYKRLAVAAQKSRAEYQYELDRKRAVGRLRQWAKSGAPKDIGLGPEFRLD